MTSAQLKLMLSVFSRRMALGETFDEVSKDYPKLTIRDLQQIKDYLSSEDDTQ